MSRAVLYEPHVIRYQLTQNRHQILTRTMIARRPQICQLMDFSSVTKTSPGILTIRKISLPVGDETELQRHVTRNQRGQKELNHYKYDIPYEEER